MTPITIEFASVYVIFMSCGSLFRSIEPFNSSHPLMESLLFYHFVGLVGLNLHVALCNHDVSLRNRLVQVSQTSMIPFVFGLGAVASKAFSR